MSSERELQILIVGGSIGGLTLGILLCRAGFDPIVIRQNESIVESNNLIELWPDMMELLSWLGLEKQIRAVGTPVDTWSLRSNDGTVKRQLIADQSSGFLTIEYSRLLNVLYTALPDRSLRADTSLREVDSIQQGVSVEFENGVNEQFDIVVGAEGVHSQTRASLSGTTPDFLGTTSYAFRLDASRPANQADERWSPDGVVFRTVSTDDATWGWLTVPADSPDSMTDYECEIVEYLRRYDWLDTETQIENEQGITVVPDFRVDPAVLAEGQIVLLGDAAHARHRLSGLGPTLAIEDAITLLDELVSRHGTLESRLHSYAARRQTRLRKLDDECEPVAPLDGIPSATSGVLSNVVATRSTRLASSFTDDPPPPTVAPRYAGEYLDCR